MTNSADTTRRDFLGWLAGLGTLLAAPRGFPGSTPAPSQLPTRPIPGTTETLPIVGLGSSKPVLEIPTAGTDPLAAVIRVLLEHGAASSTPRRARRRSTPSSARSSPRPSSATASSSP